MQRLSLRWLVPIFIAVILAAAVSVFGAVAYRGARASMLATTSERLRIVAQTFSQPTGQAPVWMREMGNVAANPAIIEVARSAGHHLSDSARDALRQLVTDTAASLLAQVRGADGRLLLNVARPLAEPSSRGAADEPLRRPVGDSAREAEQLANEDWRLPSPDVDSSTTSQLYSRGNKVFYSRTMPIHDAGSQLVGHLVEVRTATVAPSALRMLKALIGKNGAFVIGNADGSLWTDLEKPVTHPLPSDSAQRYVRDGRQWLSASGRLATSPWYVSVELPEDEVLSPVRALLWRFIVVGFLVVVAGTGAAEWFSRRLTIPVTGLTTAAESIAAGDLSPQGVVLNRPDEIGRLSRAFGKMADSIRQSQRSLEAQIGERTAELEQALVRLHEAQDELVRKERLATLGQVSGSIGHELRNPLGVMTNALYYLDMVLHDAPPKVRDHLAKLHSQVRLSETIISGLLDYARVRTPDRSAVNVAQLIDAQLARVQVPASVRVERHIDANVPDVLVDPLQTGQIVVNLLTNALQAMNGTGGTLTVSAREWDEYVSLEVADTGPGIAPELLEKIFEPLFTTKARGIGLGLAVARTLARSNGGELVAANRAEGGAVFTVRLPRVAAEVSAANADRDMVAAADHQAMGAV